VARSRGSPARAAAPCQELSRALGFRAQIFCEANQLLEFCTCLDFNDYDLFSMPERLMLLLFDVAFVWVTVVLGHMSQLQGVAGREDASLSGERRPRTSFALRPPCRSLTADVLSHQTSRWTPKPAATFKSASPS
jgi:hypothetical protein